MRFVYANARYKHNSSEGGPAHMRQFMTKAKALGHEMWLWHGEPHPAAHPVPAGRIERLKLLRSMDLIYYRVEWKPPMNARWALPPYRRMIGSPLIVWEFNTVPEYGRVQGVPEPVIQQAIEGLRRYGAGVNLAVCVSQMISDYVRENLGIRRVLTVPNGSDPELFHPDAPPNARLRQITKSPDQLQVVWIGSANLAWHNFELLRDAAWSIWNRGEGAKVIFHLIGHGMNGMRDTPPNMHYYGPEEYTNLPGWLAWMDVGVNVYRPGPADYSSPLKVFDYLASGLTVVSTMQPQAKEVFEKLNQTDLLVPSDNPEALANVLRGLAADRDRVQRQGAASRKIAVDHYNWRRAVVDTFAEIEKLRK